MRQDREGGQVGKDGLRALGGQEFVVARSGTFAVAVVVGSGIAAEDVVGRQEAADADAEGAHELDQAAKLDREPRPRDLDNLGFARALYRPVQEQQVCFEVGWVVG